MFRLCRIVRGTMRLRSTWQGFACIDDF